MIGATLGSSLIGAASASSAAKAQKEASDKQVALQSRIYDEQTQNFAPYLEGGTDAYNALKYLMGIGEQPTFGGTAPEITTVTSTLPGTSTTRADDLAWYGGSGQPTTRTQYSVNGNLFDTMDAAQEYANANKAGGTAYEGFTGSPGYEFRLNEGLGALEGTAAARGGLFSGNAMKSALQYGQDYASNEYNNYLGQIASMASAGRMKWERSSRVTLKEAIFSAGNRGSATR